MTRAMITIIGTGIAIVISGIIQHNTYGLTVYHALILLGLSWLTAFTAISPYITVLAAHFGSDEDKLSSKLRRRLVVLTSLHCAHLTISASFGIWVFSNIQDFDTTGKPSCTPSTVWYIFSHRYLVIEPLFRRIALALYCLTVLPVWNLALIIGCVYIFGDLVTRPFYLIIACVSGIGRSYDACENVFKPDDNYTREVEGLRALKNNAGVLAISLFVVVSIEKTIRANTVGPGEEQWTLGQTLALSISLIPVVDFGIWVVRMFLGRERHQQTRITLPGLSQAPGEDINLEELRSTLPGAPEIPEPGEQSKLADQGK
jgi:hypothetical protein